MTEHHKTLNPLDRERFYPDLGYWVRYGVTEYLLEVVCYRVYRIYKDDGSGELELAPSGRPWLVGGRVGGEPVDDPDSAEVEFSASVKWDGCSNWSLFGTPQLATHFCGREQVVGLGEMLTRLYDLAAESIPAWSN